MKPRNKQEVLILGYSKELIKAKPLTAKHKKWATVTVHEACYTPYYKEVLCLDCGHQFKPDPDKITKPKSRDDKPDDLTCPCCKKTLKYNNNSVFGSSTTFQATGFFSIYDVCEGFQVERIAVIQKYMTKKKKAEYFISEVVQRWISDKGEVTTITKARGDFKYYDSFNLGSAFEIRKHTMAQAYDVYPERAILPTLERNGFLFQPFIGERISEIMTELLTNNFFEFLIKSGQYEVSKRYIKSYTSEQNRIKNHSNQFRICSKNNYIIKDAGDYLDYIDLLVHFEKDINNPVYLCPPDFHQAHQDLVRKKAKIQAKEDATQREILHQILTKKYQQKKKQYLDLTIQDEVFTITVPKTIDDFYNAGEELLHCIYENEYYKKPTLILFAYKSGQLIETAEVDPKKKEVIQCRGYDNEPTEHNRAIVSLIQQNIHLLNPKKMQHAN